MTILPSAIKGLVLGVGRSPAWARWPPAGCCPAVALPGRWLSGSLAGRWLAPAWSPAAHAPAAAYPAPAIPAPAWAWLGLGQCGEDAGSFSVCRSGGAGIEDRGGIGTDGGRRRSERGRARRRLSVGGGRRNDASSGTCETVLVYKKIRKIIRSLREIHVFKATK